MNGQDLISCMRSSSGHIKKAPTENNENFTKKCGISKIICDTTCRGVQKTQTLKTQTTDLENADLEKTDLENTDLTI